MRVSARVRYGLRLMLSLGLHYGKGPVFLKDIAREEEISHKYLSQIIIPLKSARFVTAFRGAHGGYMLAKHPSQITVREIIELLEGDLNLVECVKNPSLCGRVPICVSRNIWATLGRRIVQTLNSITLEDLVKMHRKRERTSVMYNI